MVHLWSHLAAALLSNLSSWQEETKSKSKEIKFKKLKQTQN